MKRPIVTCPCCNGLGKTKLSDVLFDTLKAITASWQSTKEIFGLLVPSSAWLKKTALNNRLVELQNLGLVDCEQRGRAKYWKIKK